MSSWLYSLILNNDKSRQPNFSLQSTVGWMQALLYEIQAEHGKRNSTQFKRCRLFFRQSMNPASDSPPLADVFEPLFSAITGAMTLERSSTQPAKAPWRRPTAVVTWYYSVYAAVRAMLVANGQLVNENHSATMRAYASNLRPKLPHPLNMRAFRTDGENYSIILPSHPRASRYDLIKSFPRTSKAARGMLLQYLSGTSKWYAQNTKAKILSEGKVSNFRSNAAKALRDSRLQNEISLMHCTFRYRGKANYRDAIYLTYGSSDLVAGTDFVKTLARCAQFLSIVSLTFVERRIGKSKTNEFVSDLRNNLRGISLATPTELFWDQI
jgi:hypothetical protein